MDNKKNGIPKLRFPGFTGAWEQRKLGEVVKITMGQSPSSKNYTDNSSDYILVQGNADMKNGRVAPRVWTTQITRQAEKGDLILSVRAPVGDIGKTDYDVVIGRGVAAIKGNEYIFQILTKMKNSGYWTRFSTGSTFESINSSNIRNAQIIIPKDDEQTKIGHFLSRFDSLIALHQRKLEHLQEQKKGLLQKMFPKNGETVPEVRFPGFTDAWEQRRLGEVTEIKTGSRNHQDSVDNGKYPFFVRSEKVERLNEYDFDTKAILVPGDGRIGEIFHYYDGKFALHQRVYKVDNFKEVNPLYLLNLFKYKFKKHALRLNAQGTVPSLRLPMFTNWNILIPNLNEQQKIGLFFQQLDSLITLHQRKLEHLELMKKGLLQQMFV